LQKTRVAPPQSTSRVCVSLERRSAVTRSCHCSARHFSLRHFFPRVTRPSSRAHVFEKINTHTHNARMGMGMLVRRAAVLTRVRSTCRRKVQSCGQLMFKRPCRRSRRLMCMLYLQKKNRHQGCACTRVLPRIIIHSVENSLLAVSDTLVFFFVLRWLAKHFARTRIMYFGYSVTSFLTIYASA